VSGADVMMRGVFAEQMRWSKRRRGKTVKLYYHYARGRQATVLSFVFEPHWHARPVARERCGAEVLG
jgi:hypothetical protein